MTPRKKVFAKRFCDAFAEQWKEDSANANGILRAYQHDTTWTEYMLGKEDSFLSRLSEQLHHAMAREWFKLDVVYYDEGQNLYPPGGMYPACFHVIIEHENQGDVEREMWKLLMFRSPLKVLIFYDYLEYEKEQNPEKARWLDEKLTGLFRMGEAADAIWPEADNTEYLFLVGNRSQEGQIPVWRDWIVNQGNFGEARRRLEGSP